MILVRFPSVWVVEYVCADVVELAITADDVIVIVALPDSALAMKALIYKVCRKPFQRTYNIS